MVRKNHLVRLVFGWEKTIRCTASSPINLPRIRKPYAWYLRVPDIAGFLDTITPVLEQRLAA